MKRCLLWVADGKADSIGGLTLLLAVLGLSTGCSIVFNGEEYRANGPSQPTLQITESPTTLDAIEVAVVTPSVDPNGEAVSYEYAWQLNGAATDVVTSAVPPERTAKGETWTVTVTPVAGGRSGAPATASTTVVNSPPIVHSVGFSTYRPRADEGLRALPGGAYDPDGDPFTFQFTWSRNDQVIPGASTQGIVLPMRGFMPGETVTVRVVARDTEDSAPVSNTATVGAAVTQWRQLQPNRASDSESFGFTVHDVSNGRIIYQVEGQTWEYYLGGNGIGARWVQLHPTGTPPPDLFTSGAIYDPNEERILVVGGLYSNGIDLEPLVNTVYALDLTRGEESWSEIPVGIDGEAPQALLWSSYVLDAERQRLLVYGTVPFEQFEATSDALWQLDLRPGMEAWSKVAVGGATPGLLAGVAWVIDPLEDVAYMAGGLTFVDGSNTPTGEGNIVYRLDLTPGSESFSAVPELLPDGIIGASAAFDPVQRRAYFIHGAAATNLDTQTNTVLAFDVDGGTYTDITMEAGVPPTLFGSASWDPARGRVLVLGGMGGASIAGLASDGTWSPIDVPWLTGPGAVSQAGVVPEDVGDNEGFIVLGGRGGTWWDPVARGGAFRFSFADDVFSPVAIAPDAGLMPPPAWGVSAWSAPGGWYDHFSFVGGWNENGPLAMESWQLDYVSATSQWRWRRNALADDGDPNRPSPRIGAVVTSGYCGGTYVTLFGGIVDEDANQVAPEGVHYLVCDPPGLNCVWGLNLDQGAPGLTYAAAIGHGFPNMVFGGFDADASSATNAIYQMQGCPGDGNQVWTELVVVDGTPPAPRLGHTISHAELPGSFETVYYVFGGQSDLGGGSTQFDDTWALRLSEPPTWTPVLPEVDADHPLPPARSHHVAMYDRDRSRLIVFGGVADTTQMNDVWELRVVQ